MRQSDQPPAGRSRAVRLDAFGGPEVLDIREVPAPQAGPGQIRVRVTAAGLNPMDWIMTADADTAAQQAVASACAILSQGVTQGLECQRTPPRSLRCDPP